jgi:membrane protein implicated in regulation of membrane protease activity
VLAYVLPIGWQVQVVLFGVLSLGAIAVWRQLRGRRPSVSPLPLLNRRGRQYEGQVCEVVDAIVNGYGKARVGDGVWTIQGPDLPAGARVRVVSVDGTVLKVVAAEEPSSPT